MPPGSNMAARLVGGVAPARAPQRAHRRLLRREGGRHD